MKVVIAGAGAVGASIARELERRGHEVAVVEVRPDAAAKTDVGGAAMVLGDACDLGAVSYTHLPSPRDVEESHMPSSA